MKSYIDNQLQKLKANHGIIFIFSIFAVYLLVQHAFVFMYTDDFGYASLTYGTDRTYWGDSFNLIKTIKYFIWHYNNWGGRVLFLGLNSVLLQLGLIWARLFQVLMIMLISIATYRITTKYIIINKLYAAVLSCALYGVISFNAVNNGLYWFSASSSYLWPIAFFLLGVILLLSDKKFYISIAVLFFISGFSQEQIGAATIFFLIFYFLVSYISKNSQLNIKILIALLSSVIGYAILYLSPGNSARMNIKEYNSFYSQSLLERTFTNFKSILFTIFSLSNSILIVMLCIASVMALWLIKKSSLIKNKYLIYGFAFAGVCFITFSVSRVFMPIATSFLLLLLFSLYFIAVFSLYFILKKQLIILGMFYAGIVSQAVMVMSPALPNRFTIFYIFMSFICITAIFTEFISQFKLLKLKLLIIVPVILVSSINASYILIGYINNSYVHIVNNETLIKVSSLNATNDIYQDIKLLKQKDDKFGGAMPYQQTYGFINYWIRDYYKLNCDISAFKWTSINDITSLPKQTLYKIDNMYPSETNAGIKFQVQSNGMSAIAITGKNFTEGCVVYFDGTALSTTFGNSGLVTALVPDELIGASKICEVYVQSDNFTSNKVAFVVK